MGTVDKLTELQYRRSVIEKCGGEAMVKKQHDAGKLTARERINALFDEGSFIETDAFVSHRCTAFGMDAKEAPADGVVTGYGSVDGRLVFAYSQDYTVIDGSVGEMHSKKICKVMDMAVKMGAPIVGMNDSAGARIEEGTDALAGYGEIFMRNARCSGVVPQISAVMGPVAGGAVYSPALSDFVFMVEKTSEMFTQGPQVISAAEGKTITAEEIGGAKVHFEKSGAAHFIAADDKECIEKIRKLIGFLPQNNLEESPYTGETDDINRVSEKLSTIVPDAPDAAYDVKAVIAELADCGEFMEVQSGYAKNIVVGFARFNGSSVGIVANQTEVSDGLLDSKACDKAARFISFCDSFNIPVVTLTDAAGFAAGEAEETSGAMRHEAKLLYAYAEATVPKVNVILRKAYGAAYIAMGSKQLGADIALAWPTAEISPMAPEGAANIIFRDDIAASSNPIDERKEKIAEYRDKYASAFEAASKGYIDDVIEPDSTRPRIIAALEMLAGKRDVLPAKKHGNIPM